MRQVSDEERRARLARRHALTADEQVSDPVDAARAVVALHATEPASVPLAVRARTGGVALDEVERALYEERTLVKQLAMRRTLFAFPRDLLPAAWGSVSARVAGQEQRRLVSDLEAAGVTTHGQRWLDDVAAEVREVLAAPDAAEGYEAGELRSMVPRLDERITYGTPGSRWAREAPVGPRVLTALGARAEVVRGRNAGGWRTSRPRWVLMVRWLGEVPPADDEPEGYAALVRRWLERYGPGTEDDLVWWLGATRTAVRSALAALEAVPVAVAGGGTGWLLPGDEDEVASVAPWAALLPVLDPTVMGWRDRDFCLPPEYAGRLRDSNGNVGTTAWWDGRAVGCWVQDGEGAVHVELCADVGSEGEEALRGEAARLTEWLVGERVLTVYPSPLMRQARERVDGGRAPPG